MKIYIITVICLQSFSLLGYLIKLSGDKYPLTETTTRSRACAIAIIQLGFIVWAGVLLAYYF